MRGEGDRFELAIIVHRDDLKNVSKQKYLIMQARFPIAQKYQIATYGTSKKLYKCSSIGFYSARTAIFRITPKYLQAYSDANLKKLVCFSSKFYKWARNRKYRTFCFSLWFSIISHRYWHSLFSMLGPEARTIIGRHTFIRHRKHRKRERGKWTLFGKDQR